MYVNVLLACLYAHHVYVWWLGEAKGRHWIPWTWSYRWLGAVKWLLGKESRSFSRVLNF